MKKKRLTLNQSTVSKPNVNMKRLDLGGIKRKKNRFSHQLPILVILFTLILGTTGFSQRESVFNDQRLFEKFMLAKRLMYKGRVLYLKGKYNQSEKALKKCLEKFPRFADADYYLAQIYYKQKNFPQALVHIKKANANYHFMEDLKVTSKLKEGGYKELDHESKIKRAKIHANYFFLHGNILFKLKKFFKASIHYIEAIKQNPKHCAAYNNLINLFYITKNFRKVFEYLNKAELSENKINPELKKEMFTQLPDLIISAYSSKKYVDADYFLKQAEAYKIEINPALKQAIINSSGFISESSPEARSITKNIIMLYNAKKYKEAMARIRQAEGKNMRIGAELKKVIEEKCRELELKNQ